MWWEKMNLRRLDNKNDEMKVRDYITKRLICVDKDETIQEACNYFIEFKISSLLVTNEDEIIGIFTKTDVIKEVVVSGKSINESVSKIMRKNLITCDIDTPISRVLTLMSKHQIKHILIKEDDEITGIFTLKDLIDLRKMYLESK